MFFRLLIIICVLLPAALSLAEAAENYLLRFAHSDPGQEANPHHIMVLEAKRLIEERTGGRVTVDIFPSKQLGNDTETVQQIQGNILEASLVYPQSMVTFVPEIQVLGIPYMFNVPGVDPDVLMLKIMNGSLMDRLDEALTAKFDNVQLVSAYGNHWRDLATTFPLQTIDDMKGRKIRTIPAPIQQQFLINLDAEPTIVNSSEVFTALGTGLIEGAKYGVLHLYAIRVVDFIKHVYVDHHVPIVCYIVANRGWLQKLPVDLRDIVVTSLKEAAVFGTLNAAKLNRDYSVQFVEEHGGHIVRPSETELESFRRAADPIKQMYTEKYGDTWLKYTALAVEEAIEIIDKETSHP
jgi:TRAP-type transport system periplasmic protein